MAKRQVDNSSGGWLAKVDIRRRVLAAVTPARAVVFDAFAGEGQLWAAVWREAARYVGCDARFFPNDERCCFVADNRRVLRCIDLAPFTVFDLDAYGSPWEQALIIAARRPRLAAGERIGFTFTDGLYIKMKLSGGRPPIAMMQAADLSRALGRAVNTHYEEVLTRALVGIARRMGGRLVTRWQAAAGRAQFHMHYVGIVVEGGSENRLTSTSGQAQASARSV